MTVFVLLVITVNQTGFFNRTIDIQSGSLVFNTSIECEAARVKVLTLTQDKGFENVSTRCDKGFISKEVQ